MNQNFVVIVIGVFFLVFQIIFALSTLKWLSFSKRKRDKDFALLDSERTKLIQMQQQLKSETSEARKLSEDTLRKLKIIGAEAHAEWEEMTKKINTVLVEVEKNSDALLQNNISTLTVQKLSIEKLIQNAHQISNDLEHKFSRAEKIFKLFDQGLPVDEILKDIQTSKYDEARKMLKSGIEASVISKKLGLPLSEIAILSSCI